MAGMWLPWINVAGIAVIFWASGRRISRIHGSFSGFLSIFGSFPLFLFCFCRSSVNWADFYNCFWAHRKCLIPYRIVSTARPIGLRSVHISHLNSCQLISSGLQLPTDWAAERAGALRSATQEASTENKTATSQPPEWHYLASFETCRLPRYPLSRW